jgi:hypothetical protein
MMNSKLVTHQNVIEHNVTKAPITSDMEQIIAKLRTTIDYHITDQLLI